MFADELTGNLDTNNSEIMDMVRLCQKINQTIILVTHDPACPGMQTDRDPVDGIKRVMKGKDSEDEIQEGQRAAAVMISAAMIIGMCGNAPC